jgi:hypothetical protein
LANNEELRIWQSNYLFTLLHLREQNLRAGQKVVGLQFAISQAKAIMQEPDIAWVEKQVAEAFN